MTVVVPGRLAGFLRLQDLLLDLQPLSSVPAKQDIRLVIGGEHSGGSGGTARHLGYGQRILVELGVLVVLQVGSGQLLRVVGHHGRRRGTKANRLVVSGRGVDVAVATADDLMHVQMHVLLL